MKFHAKHCCCLPHLGSELEHECACHCAGPRPMPGEAFDSLDATFESWWRTLMRTNVSAATDEGAWVEKWWACLGWNTMFNIAGGLVAAQPPALEKVNGDAEEPG